MNEDSTGDPKVPGDLGAHHIGEGRNVVHGDQGRGRRDVFFASVQMSRLSMCLSECLRMVSPTTCLMVARDRSTIISAVLPGQLHSVSCRLSASKPTADLQADDYLARPFSIAELLARVAAQLRPAAPRAGLTSVQLEAAA